jgi:pre-60S factor REI1
MSGQATHPFTCNTCQVAFRSGELQRTHMQSDWHRYNLKRRVASLPPLASEVFAEKVLANKATAAATAARASFEKGCDVCTKTYYSENAYLNHLSSQKHKTNVARLPKTAGKSADDDLNSVMSSTFSLGESIEKIPRKPSMDEDSEDDFSDVVNGVKDATLEDESDSVAERKDPALTRTTTNTTTDGRAQKRDSLLECLFCNNMFDSLAASLDHMQKTHGMFIPERDYLVDLEGLVRFLNKKVNEEHECLYCGRLKWSEDGIKTHMRDMSHCKIAYENEDQQLEIGQFYDFRSTYSGSEWDSDEDEDMEDAAPGGGVKLGAKRANKTVVETGDSENLPDAGEEAGWETDSTASSVPTDELGRVYLDDQRDEVKERLKQNRHHSHTDTRKHRGVDGFHSHAHSTPHAVYHDEYELHLPSGRTAGHRSLNKYYRQNLHAYPTPAEREQRLLTQGSDSDEEPKTNGRDRGRQVIARSEGGLGMLGVTDAKKREIRAVEKRELKREQRTQQRVQWKVDQKGNSQKHFRDPLLQ